MARKTMSGFTRIAPMPQERYAVTRKRLLEDVMYYRFCVLHGSVRSYQLSMVQLRKARYWKG